jgi:two-component system chemotaxis response regulator CheY
VLNILIVDDSIIIRQSVKQIVEKLGHKVIGQAKSGHEAIRMAKSLKPDLVTMDITMPLMSGVEALEKIKKNHPDMTVIMMTSHGEESMIMDALEKGAQGYILKPIDSEKVYKALSLAKAL